MLEQNRDFYNRYHLVHLNERVSNKKIDLPDFGLQGINRYGFSLAVSDLHPSLKSGIASYIHTDLKTRMSFSFSSLDGVDTITDLEELINMGVNSVISSDNIVIKTITVGKRQYVLTLIQGVLNRPNLTVIGLSFLYKGSVYSLEITGDLKQNRKAFIDGIKLILSNQNLK